MTEMTPEQEREEHILKTLKNLVEGLPKAQAKLKAIDATTEADPREALADLIRRANRAEEMSKDLYIEQTTPLKKMLDRFDGIWRPLVKGFGAVSKDARAKVDQWVLLDKKRRLVIEQQKTAALRATQEAQRVAEEKARAATTTTERVRAEIEAGRLFAKQEEIIAEIPDAMPEPVAGMSSAPDWDYEVEDVGAFASAFPTCVEVKRAETLKIVRAAAKEGRKVPGLRIVDSVRTAVR